jgi:hypothetical protein
MNPRRPPVAERRKRSPLGTTDIVARLLDVTEMSWDGDEVTDPLCEEAAAEIEWLRQRVDALTELVEAASHRVDRTSSLWLELRHAVEVHRA